jgi:hypothetical protein
MRRSTMTASGLWATRWSARPKLRCSRSVTSARPDRSLFGPVILRGSAPRFIVTLHSRPEPSGSMAWTTKCGISFASRKGPPSAARQ